MPLWASTFMWVLVILFTIPGTFRVVMGQGLDNDATKLAFHLVGWVLLAFNLRWFLAPDNLYVLNVLRCFSAILAGFLLVIVRFYRQ